MLPKSTTIMPINKKTKSSLTTQAKTKLWSLCQQQQIPLNATKILITNELNKKHNKTEAIVDCAAHHDTIPSNSKRNNNNNNSNNKNKCIKHKILTITTTTTSPAGAAAEKAKVAQRKHLQQHCKPTALKCNNNSKSNGSNNSNNINNENNINCSNNSNNSYSNHVCSSTTASICKKTLNNKRKHQRNSYWSSYLSSPSASASAPASAPASLSSTCSTSIRFLVSSSSSSAHSWIFCLWLCLAISSLAFVHCIPSPSSSIQQPQKRGKNCFCFVFSFPLYNPGFILYFRNMFLLVFFALFKQRSLKKKNETKFIAYF